MELHETLCEEFDDWNPYQLAHQSSCTAQTFNGVGSILVLNYIIA
jgi:hypothetical protein